MRRSFQPPGEAHSISYGANSGAGHYAQINGAKIYYEVYGSGHPLVILHGGGFGSTMEIMPFIDSLKADYRVIAVSTRGHGKSETGSTPFTSEQKANDILAAPCQCCSVWPGVLK